MRLDKGLWGVDRANLLQKAVLSAAVCGPLAMGWLCVKFSWQGMQAGNLCCAHRECSLQVLVQ